jgi:hypothetical protein
MIKKIRFKKVTLTLTLATVLCNDAQAIVPFWQDNADSYASFFWSPEAIAAGLLTPFNLFKDAISGIENYPMQFATALFGCVGLSWLYKKWTAKPVHKPANEIWFLKKENRARLSKEEISKIAVKIIKNKNRDINVAALIEREKLEKKIKENKREIKKLDRWSHPDKLNRETSPTAIATKVRDTFKN